MDIAGLKGMDASTYMQHITEQTSRKATETLKQTLEGTAQNNQATEEELMDACKQFEAYFLEQVFKSMMKPIDSLREANGAKTNTITDFYKEQTLSELAKTSTKGQGLGLAQMLFENMKRNYHIGEDGASAGKGEENPSAGEAVNSTPASAQTATDAAAVAATDTVAVAAKERQATIDTVDVRGPHT